jgi:hypothetical protein
VINTNGINKMKKIILLAFVASVALSSCARRYTCPTYSKVESPAHNHASIQKAGTQAKG